MRTRIFSGIVGALTLAACSTDGGSDPSAMIGSQGMYLRSEIPESADVNGIRFEFTPVSCEDGSPTGEPSISVDRELEPFKIPGGIGELEDNPLDADSEHYFADAFETLDPGCYDVTSTPIQESGEASELCAPAVERAVEVLEGETTEIFMINQCGGNDPGALDAISTLNHEPKIDDVSFEESKFRVCGQTQVVCATVTDPDKDPIEFEWELSESSPFAAGPVVVSRDEDPETGAVTECVEYEPSSPGKYDITVRAYDQLWDDGVLRRIEDWLAEEGYPGESHSELDFFFYVSRSGLLTSGGGALHLGHDHGDHSDILILDTTVAGGTASSEAVSAVANGFTVDVVDAATWGAMTTPEFAAYKAIVIGDPNCGMPSRTDPAVANVDIWSAAVTGNVMLIGTDQSLHGHAELNRDGIAFAAAKEGQTGAFISLSCDYHYFGLPVPATVPYLSGLGDFTVDALPGGVGTCFNDAHVVADHPALASVDDIALSNWGCSVHEVFTSWPENYEVLAIAEYDGGPYTAGDGTTGSPYILANGVIPTGCGDGELNAGEECDDGNNENGDGCDEACNEEVCGDGIEQAGEECDDSNTENGDGCSNACTIEGCF